MTPRAKGSGAGGKTIVFGILERRVSVEIVHDVSAETLMLLTVKKVRRGSIIYYEMEGIHSCFVDTDCRLVMARERGKVYINSIEGFWRYAKERLIKHHGISQRKFLM